MTEVPVAVRQCAEAFELDPSHLRGLGGNSGSSWAIGKHVLRVGLRAGEEILALSAAAAVLPVPKVHGRVDVGPLTGVLLERLPGRPAGALALARPDRAEVAGQACGRLHAALSGVRAPAGLRPVGKPEPDGRLLHLDLHPFNVLVDDEGVVTGVIDWSNAASGEPMLDRARSWSILTLDPAARARRSAPGWLALTEAWIHAADLMNLPPRARAWACEFMLRDLARRYPGRGLDYLKRALTEARTGSG